MNSSLPALTAEEHEQLQQTVEMFEVIVQASPQDCQSMEILKEAYYRLGKEAEGHLVARRLADLYLELGQLTQAMMEYEGVLQHHPGDPEVIAALAEVEERIGRVAAGVHGTAANSTVAVPTGGLGGVKIEYEPTAFEGGTLIATKDTLRVDAPAAKAKLSPTEVHLASDGNDQLAKFLTHHKLAPEEVVATALDRVRKRNAERDSNNVLPTPLLDEVSRRGAIEMETLLSGILERSKFAYIPLEYYDVDRTIVKMLPEDLTLGRLIVPFDVMSRTLMIAMANPFDVAAKESVQQLLDYNIQWHLAAPGAVLKALAETYKIGATPEALNFRLH